MTALVGQEADGDGRSGEHEQCAHEEHWSEADHARREAEGGTADTEREVQEGGVGAHGEPTALRRHAQDRLDAEAGIDQGIAKAG